MIYGIEIKKLRERNGVTQKQLAEYIGIDPKLYSHYETEDRLIPCKHLISVCDYFGVSADCLFGFVNENYSKSKKVIVDKVEVGKRLKEFRKEHKITQGKLASILNTSQSVIAEYEKGKNLIATPFLYTICKKYNISADYLLGRIDHPKYFK